MVNPIFERNSQRYLPGIRQVFEKAGVTVELLEATPDRSAKDAIARAVQEHLDAVIVCGGDGTVFDALQGLAGSETPLGICPFGTGNILAQNLKIPLHPVEAAQWLLAAKPRSVPLGKITCPTATGEHSWFFAMAAGMGGHAAMMKAAERYGKHRAGKIAYFGAGLETLFTYPLEPFEVEITTVGGEVFQRRVSELIAVRVAELNLWRPGGGLDLPFLRLASIEGASRLRLAQASWQALALGEGQRNRTPRTHAAARYEDVMRVVCRPIPGMKYKQAIAVEADGEILGSSCATIEMAKVNIKLLETPLMQ
ncbi:MAG TPA: diacylglycerol kinase family protein [Edaphobacter sp.]|nr:diacylglycerol kinase family protein [Edaphobacter sp.]